MFKDDIKSILIANKHKRILLYGPEGIGKTYLMNKLFEDIRGGFIIVDFGNDDITGMINALKKGKDITDALVTSFCLSEELRSVTFVFDEFLELDHIENLTELLTVQKANYKYPDIKIIYVTSNMAWCDGNLDRFDICVKAGKITFAEYLQKSGESFYSQVVDAHMTKKKSMPSLIHNELTDMYYQYISTSGYPRPIEELTHENPIIFPDIYAAERYKTLIGSICTKEGNSTSAFNKIQIINAIPECAKNSKFVISKTGRRHISKEQLESDINDLIKEGIIIRIPRLNGNTYSLALTDDGIYLYLLRKNRYKLSLNEEKIKELVTENHLRNILFEQGIKTYSWAGKYRFKINVLIESKGKYYPVKVSCKKSVRNVSFDEFFSSCGSKSKLKIQFTENPFNETKDTICMPIYGCEYLKNVIPQQ